MYKKNSESLQRRASSISIKDITTGHDEVTDEEKHRILSARLQILAKKIAEKKVKFSFHKNRSLISQIKARYKFKKYIPEEIEDLIAMADEYSVIIEVLKKIKQKTTNGTKWRHSFVDAARSILSAEEFEKVRKHAEYLETQFEIKRMQMEEK